MERPVKAIIAGFFALGLVSMAALANAREHINIVGSSTVYPFSIVVAERLGKITDNPAPIVEATGSGGGMKLFCSGLGSGFPDVTNSSRRIKKSELELCKSNGVKEIIEVLFGFDGIVLANSNKANLMSLSLEDIFLGLAKLVPNPDGSETLVENPYMTWRDVNPNLPDQIIKVLGPPPTSGTRDAFVELGLEGGCKKFDFIMRIKEQDASRFKAICHAVREDGAFIEAGENDNLIVQKLEKNPKALGMFGFSFLDQNTDKVQASIIEGQVPSVKTIADKSYPISRPLYFYVKKAHVGVVPGIQFLIDEFTSEKAWGEEGYLTEKGMIPMQEASRREIAARVRSLTPMTYED